jgi:hypothetical protein
MSVLETLTEGIKARSLANEGEALLGKWEKTGLLEGLSDVRSSNMARLLENQAAQLLKESSTMAAGDVEGFSAVAFPIVRRVFGNLLAQDLVSVQPMSLPSGLIFFLDFTYEKSVAAAGAVANESVYGGGVVGSGLTGGVDLGANPTTDPEKSFYALNNGYSAATASAVTNKGGAAGTVRFSYGDGLGNLGSSKAVSALTSGDISIVDADPDLLATATTNLLAVRLASADIAAVFPNLNER